MPLAKTGNQPNNNKHLRCFCGCVLLLCLLSKINTLKMKVNNDDLLLKSKRRRGRIFRLLWTLSRLIGRPITYTCEPNLPNCKDMIECLFMSKRLVPYFMDYKTTFLGNVLNCQLCCQERFYNVENTVLTLSCFSPRYVWAEASGGAFDV